MPHYEHIGWSSYITCISHLNLHKMSMISSGSVDARSSFWQTSMPTIWVLVCWSWVDVVVMLEWSWLGWLSWLSWGAGWACNSSSVIGKPVSTRTVEEPGGGSALRSGIVSDSHVNCNPESKEHKCLYTYVSLQYHSDPLTLSQCIVKTRKA